MSDPKSEPKAPLTDELAHAIAESINVDVQMGHPLDPTRGQLRSVEDEQRLDEKGEPVVHGEVWSKTGTGLYLNILVTRERPLADRPMYGGVHCDVPSSLMPAKAGSRMIAVGVTMGKPTFNIDYWGAALELPSDLARDELKRRYVVEWIGDTAVEALRGAGARLSVYPERASELGLWVAASSENAIQKAGL